MITTNVVMKDIPDRVQTTIRKDLTTIGEITMMDIVVKLTKAQERRIVIVSVGRGMVGVVTDWEVLVIVVVEVTERKVLVAPMEEVVAMVGAVTGDSPRNSTPVGGTNLDLALVVAEAMMTTLDWTFPLLAGTVDSVDMSVGQGVTATAESHNLLLREMVVSAVAAAGVFVKIAGLSLKAPAVSETLEVSLRAINMDWTSRPTETNVDTLVALETTDLEGGPVGLVVRERTWWDHVLLAFQTQGKKGTMLPVEVDQVREVGSNVVVGRIKMVMATEVVEREMMLGFYYPGLEEGENRGAERGVKLLGNSMGTCTGKADLGEIPDGIELADETVWLAVPKDRCMMNHRQAMVGQLDLVFPEVVPQLGEGVGEEENKAGMVDRGSQAVGLVWLLTPKATAVKTETGPAAQLRISPAKIVRVRHGYIAFRRKPIYYYCFYCILVTVA